MDRLFSNIELKIPESIFLKDPQSSDLGRKILSGSIELIEAIGFEDFTFKKLGCQINSNESSVYRYFENKHSILVYLCSWYWAWMEYRLVMHTFNLNDQKLKLYKAVEVLSETIETDSQFTFINEIKLQRIVINENSKSFLTKKVDEENQAGYFSIYKNVIHRLTNMILDVNPSYTQPKALATSVIEVVLHQHFLKEHFPTLCDSTTPEYVQEIAWSICDNALNTKP